MEANKDKANVCLDDGHMEDTKEFLSQIKKVIPTTEADKMKKQSTSNIDADGQNAKKSTLPGSSKGENQSTYTKAELDMVIKVNNSKNYYKILNIKKNATKTDIKKAYKKLALALHPDKNHAPGADEAFKTVVKAVTTLSDETKRQLYNLTCAKASLTDISSDDGFEYGNYDDDDYDDDDDDDDDDKIDNDNDIIECISVLKMYMWLRTAQGRNDSFESYYAELKQKDEELKKSKPAESDQKTGNKHSFEYEEKNSKKQKLSKEPNEKNVVLEKEREGKCDAK